MNKPLLAAVLAVSAFAVHAAEPRVINVKLDSFKITPNQITVKVGQPVTLKVKNDAWFISHDLVIKAPDADIDIKVDLRGGESGEATFTPTKPGTYKMYCDKKSPGGKTHDEKGMHGTLVVE
jgi:uncharacterized cupredoxin-like copper-binding protein